MKSIIPITLLVFLLAFISCDKEEAPIEGATAIPEIIKLTAIPDTIEFGGAITSIVCEATGGGLSYEWDVDLGDIFPSDIPGEVSYSGSACCIGLKEIKCKVTNSLGSTNSFVNVFILEPIE